MYTKTSPTYTVGEKKDSTLHRAYGVKLPLLRAVWAGQGLILPLEKLLHFFLGPWLLVCQFIDISNQMETTGEVSNIKRIFLCNRPLYKFFCSTLDTSPVDSIWLEMAINWHTKSQGPKKKCAHFSWGRIHSCPAGTARNQGSFTSMALWSVQSFLSSTVFAHLIISFLRLNPEHVTKIS